MALPIYFTGTVSVAAGGTVVTLTGGIWSGINARQGDFISIDNSDGILITEITDATHLKIPPWQGAAKSNVTYVIYQNYVGRVVGVAAAEDVGDMLEKLHVDGLPFIVGSDEEVPDPSYGDEGQLAFKPSTGEWWEKTGGAWVPSDGLVAAGYGGSSTSSVTIGTGVKTFQLEPNLAYAGGRVRASVDGDPTKYVEGLSDYDPTTGIMTITSDTTGGSGTFADWEFSVVGSQGAAGPTGPAGPAGGTFADAPSDGTTYGRKNAAWVAVTSGGAAVLVSDTAPAGASDNSLWWESDTGILYIRYNDGSSTQWVAVGGGGDGAGMAFANPTTPIGLTPINGVSTTTAMRSDAAPALSQSIAPTWTGLHAYTANNGGVAVSGNPSSVNLGNVLFGLEHYGISSILTAVQPVDCEVAIAAQMTSNVGAGTGFKAAAGFHVIMNPGSSPCWTQSNILTMNAGVPYANGGGIVAEYDLDIMNANYPVDAMFAGNPFVMNINVNGTSNSNHYYATAGIGISSTYAIEPLWDVGLLLGWPGHTGFRTAAIYDASNAQISFYSKGHRSIDIMHLINQRATPGDVGINLGVGSNGTADSSSVYINFVIPNETNQAGVIKRADSGGVAHVSYNVSSDARLKKSIGTLDDALERIAKIDVHRYQAPGYEGTDYNVGFFAQNLHAAFPWAVTPSDDPDFRKHPWHVDYGKVTALLVAAVKDLLGQVHRLEQKVKKPE